MSWFELYKTSCGDFYFWLSCCCYPRLIVYTGGKNTQSFQLKEYRVPWYTCSVVLSMEEQYIPSTFSRQRNKESNCNRHCWDQPSLAKIGDRSFPHLSTLHIHLSVPINPQHRRKEPSPTTLFIWLSILDFVVL